MGRRLALIGAALASAGVALVAPSGAQAATFTLLCPADPGPVTPSITNDAAIEVHALRREQAEACAVLLERSDGIAEDADLAWWGAWACVGLLLSLLVAPMMQRAFRWWQE